MAIFCNTVLDSYLYFRMVGYPNEIFVEAFCLEILVCRKFILSNPILKQEAILGFDKSLKGQFLAKVLCMYIFD